MFMMSIRLSRRRLILGALAVVLVIGAFWLGGRLYKGEEEAVSAKTSSVSSVAEKKVDAKKTAAKTNDQRVEFIGAFGWEVNAEPAEVLEVIIPKDFDEVYKQYNSIQKLQGCDLEPLAGKRCKRYSYEVTNYPGRETGVRINLLVYKNKIVGGDVCSMDEGGFMHGFAQEQ